MSMKTAMMRVSASRLVILASVMSLTACVNSLISTNDGKVDSNSPAGQVVVIPPEHGDEKAELVVDPDLPSVDLDATTLEQLLIQNFATQRGDWSLASRNAWNAAQTTRDYRVARASTLLSLKDNDYGKTLQGAELWLELKPDSKDARNILLLSQLGSGLIQESIEGLAALRQEKDLEQHIKQVAGLVVRQINMDAALSVMRHYISMNTESAQVHLSSAYVAEVFKQHEQAQKWLDEAIALKPGWELAAQMKAEILSNRGQIEERSVFIARYAQAHPQSVSMSLNYAADLARQERYQQALDVMQSLLGYAPKDSDALTYAGALAHQLENTVLAKRYYHKAIEQDPQNDDARWSLGRLAIIEEKYVTAERLFNDISEGEFFIRAQIQVANARYHTKGIGSALATLNLLEPRTEGDYIDVALARHNLLLRVYQYEEAFGYINEVLLYLPENLDLLYARALIAAELRKTAVAEADFRAILGQQPNNADYLNALGYTLADQTQRYEEARALIQQALEIRPDASHILDSMGWVLYRLKDYDNAIAYLKKAYTGFKEVEIGAHLGEVLWVSGNQEEAREVWRQVHTKAPDNPVLNATLEQYGIEILVDKVSVVE